MRAVPLTVITNTLNIVDELSQLPQIALVAIGILLRSTFGPFVEQTAEFMLQQLARITCAAAPTGPVGYGGCRRSVMGYDRYRRPIGWSSNPFDDAGFWPLGCSYAGMSRSCSMVLAAAILLLAAHFAFGADGKARSTQRTRVVNPANALEKVNDASDTSSLSPGAAGVSVIRAQILIDRARFSPGEIDGRFGPDLEIAVKGYQERHKLKPSGIVDKELWALLNADTDDLLTSYTITPLDLREELVTIPKGVEEQEKLKRMGYQTADERMSEKFHLSPKLLMELNPNKKFDKAGEEILVPSLRRQPVGRAAKVVVSKSKRTVTALGANGTVLAQYPATMGGPHDPLPIGSWKITVVRPYPVFYYSPERFWNAKQDGPKAQLPPGPNNPAGTVWLGLSKPHYGIHGSPEPGTVRRMESYGCIRLTNWDASDLSRMVRVGTPAILEE